MRRLLQVVLHAALPATPVTLILCFSDPAHAQVSSGWVQGKIRDKATGTAVENAQVALLDARGKELARSGSGPSGEFFFLALPAGEYAVRLEKAGYGEYVV